ncbi:MAG: hypothetical protein H0W72_14085 [Planctomycetes bacterium]|nr:hypothetical protein [Planctomycetota bacterium]
MLSRLRIDWRILMAGIMAVILGLAWALYRDDQPELGHALSAAELLEATPDLAGDLLLIGHLRMRWGGHPDTAAWQGLNEDARALYAMLHLEELDRTIGLGPGCAGRPVDHQNVTPADAADGYLRIGHEEAAALMRALTAVIAEDGARWRSIREPPTDTTRPLPPDPARINGISAAMARLLPAIRTARLRWIREHLDGLTDR